MVWIEWCPYVTFCQAGLTMTLWPSRPSHKNQKHIVRARDFLLEMSWCHYFCTEWDMFYIFVNLILILDISLYACSALKCFFYRTFRRVCRQYDEYIYVRVAKLHNNNVTWLKKANKNSKHNKYSWVHDLVALERQTAQYQVSGIGSGNENGDRPILARPQQRQKKDDMILSPSTHIQYKQNRSFPHFLPGQALHTQVCNFPLAVSADYQQRAPIKKSNPQKSLSPE